MTMIAIINLVVSQTLVMNQKMLPLISDIALENPDNVGDISQLTLQNLILIYLWW
jgi:hypothetical protein